MQSPRAEQGAVAVEFAVIFPILAMLIFGIIEFGAAWNREQAMEAAAREGARLASIGVDVNAIRDRISDALPSTIDFADVGIEVRRYDEGDDLSSTTGVGSMSSGVPCDGDPDSHAVRVDIAVTSNLDDYAISIPFWGGRGEPAFPAYGVFRCEAGP